MPYNLESRNGLLEPVDLTDLTKWFVRETGQVGPESVRHVVAHVGEHLDDFVQFAEEAILLWQDCNRVALEGERQRYHKYPGIVKELAKSEKFRLDTRPNGPCAGRF